MLKRVLIIIKLIIQILLVRLAILMVIIIIVVIVIILIIRRLGEVLSGAAHGGGLPLASMQASACARASPPGAPLLRDSIISYYITLCYVILYHVICYTILYHTILYDCYII